MFKWKKKVSKITYAGKDSLFDFYTSEPVSDFNNYSYYACEYNWNKATNLFTLDIIKRTVADNVTTKEVLKQYDGNSSKCMKEAKKYVEEIF